MPLPILSRIAGGLPAMGFVNIVVATNTATGFAAAQILTATRRAEQAYISVDGTATVRFRYDGTAPTSSVGHQLASLESIAIQGYTNLQNIQFISIGTATSSLMITLEGGRP